MISRFMDSALVNKNQQGLSMYGGVPAKFIKKLD